MLNLKVLGLAAAVAISAPAVASAAIMGQLDISGTVNLDTSDINPGGNVDLNDPGIVIFSSGLFSTLTAFVDQVDLTDIDFNAPGEIWSVGGFTFVADTFSNFGDLSFEANGTVTGAGVNQTGLLSFSAQDRDGTTRVSFSSTTVTPAPSEVPLPAAGLLLIAGLGALGIAGRKKAA